MHLHLIGTAPQREFVVQQGSNERALPWHLKGQRQRRSSPVDGYKVRAVAIVAALLDIEAERSRWIGVTEINIRT